MGKYDNYSNIKNIKKAQKKLDKLTSKRKPNQYKIELTQKELDEAKLFESCQIFKSWHGDGPNERVMFSDDNRVMLFINRLIRYEDITACRIDPKIVTTAHTVTRTKGGISRAIIGGAIGGDVGAVVGAMTADTHSETTYYQLPEGFYFRVFMKDDRVCSYEIESIGFISNKLPPRWEEVRAKIQRIIDGRE